MALGEAVTRRDRENGRHGIEYPIVDNLSLKTEYLYTQYGGMTVAYQTLAMLPFSFTDTTRGSLSTGTIGLHIARSGLNWKL